MRQKEILTLFAAKVANPDVRDFRAHFERLDTDRAAYIARDAIEALTMREPGRRASLKEVDAMLEQHESQIGTIVDVQHDLFKRTFSTTSSSGKPSDSEGFEKKI